MSAPAKPAAKPVTPAPYRSGFCGYAATAENHRRCPGGHGHTACACPCHACCPTCGQLLPNTSGDLP